MTRLASAVAATLLAAPAFAADLPSRYAPAPYYEPAPIFSWTGFYAGANGALGVGSYTQGGSRAFGNPLGGLGGVTVGYNYQSGRLLVGAEADIAFGSLSDNGTLRSNITGSGTINTIGTARARVGYVWNQALIYATGGYAGTSLNGHLNDYARSPNLVIQDSHYLNGYAVGAGVEYAITTKISIKGEYIFTGFSSTPFFGQTRDALNAGANVNLIRAGLNYHF